MINVVLPENSFNDPVFLNRFQYTAEVVFGRVLNTTFNVIKSSGNLLSDNISLFYLKQDFSAFSGAFFIPDSGYLALPLPQLAQTEPPIEYREGIPLLFPVKTDTENKFLLPFDLFGACFFLLTEPHAYRPAPALDVWGRYDESQNYLIRNKLHEHPLVHLYAEALWNTLKNLKPGLKRSVPQFAVKYTFDIDQPFKYLHKPPAVQIAGFVKDVIQGDFSGLKTRTHTRLSGRDPNDTLAYIQSVFPSDDTAVFFLAGGTDRHDSRFHFGQKIMRDLVLSCRNKGIEIGVHPSFLSAEQPEKIRTEIQKLKSVLGEKSLHSSRQHFLKYRLPLTYNTLAQAGIRYDYTTCFYSQPGFKHGMARPFPFFDLEAGKKSELMLHPTHIADRTLISYLGITPERAERVISEIREKTEAVGGILTFLFHNEIFSEIGEWKGWNRIGHYALSLYR